MKSKKTILVTGGVGFIGSHLCDALVKKNYKVVCLDNFLTGSKKNVNHLIGKANFKLVKHDVEKPYYFKVDQIYNLACPAAPVWYQKDPVKTVRTNILGAINALELAKKLNIRVLQASTSEIYGDPLKHPQKETYFGNVNCLSPRACYDEGKRCAETLFMDYHRQHGVDIAIIRIHNTYGPKMAVDDGRVVSNFIIQALKGEPLTVYGKGEQTRSFMYIDDLIKAMIKTMDKKNFIGPVNIGNPNELNVAGLAKKIIKLTKSRSGIVYRLLPQDDPRKRRPDINLAKKTLNWRPKVNLGEGISKTVKYFKHA
jgi:UDP-glucuronate decarboxylase